MDLSKLDANSYFVTFRVYIFILRIFQKKWYIHMYAYCIFVYFENILESKERYI